MNLFIRIVIAVLIVVALGALIPLVAGVLGFPLSADVVQIFRICGAVIAVFYIIFGDTPSLNWWRS